MRVILRGFHDASASGPQRMPAHAGIGACA